MSDTPKVKANAVQVGDVVLFRWHRTWVQGVVVGDGNSIRVPLKRFSSDPDFKPSPRRTYWRNRSDLFAVGEF